MRRALLLVACALACRKSPPPPAQSGSAVVADPWRGVDAAPETPQTRRARAEAALARVADIQPKLAKLRGLAFDRPVPTAYQTTDEFRAFLRTELAKELPPEKSAKLSTAYLHIGLLAKPVDIAKAYEQTMASQAAAYYDPGAKKFFIVMVPDSELMLDTISAHELTHGLQDQRFDLKKYMSPQPALDDDATFARQFVVEGDATLAMFLYGAAEGVKSDTLQPVVIKLLRDQIKRFAAMDIAAYDRMMKEQASSFPNLDADLKASMESVGQLPPAIVGPLLASYMKGAAAVLAAYDQGGWPAVDALYRDPPQSTEQLLHPTTKLFPKRDLPRRITLAKLSGQELTTNTMGELLWSVYFNVWGVTDASEGWGGDHYAVVKRSDGTLLAFFATAWDTEQDAKEFAASYEASIAKRFPARDRKIATRRTGTNVYILDGDDDPKLFAQLIAQTKIL